MKRILLFLAIIGMFVIGAIALWQSRPSFSSPPYKTTTNSTEAVVPSPSQTATADAQAPENTEGAEATSWHKSKSLPNGRQIIARPARYKTITRNILITPARKTEKKTPAVTKDVVRQVIKTPAQTVEKTIPAVTKTISKKVLVSKASYKKRSIPARKKTYVTPLGKKESIVISEAREEYDTVPAKFKTIQEKITIQEATTEVVTIPATYETITETITLQPESVEYVIVPAEYETVEEQILLEPARLVLSDKEGHIIHDFLSKQELNAFLAAPDSSNFVLQPAYIEKTDIVTLEPETIEYMTVPGTAQTMTETVVVQDASTELVTVPPLYETITETIIIKPETVKYEVVPSKVETISRQISTRGSSSGFETINISKTKRNARLKKRTIPAITQTFTRRVLKTPAAIQERVIPAVTRQETRRVVNQPAQTVERVTPAQTEEVTRMVQRNQTAPPLMPGTSQTKLFSWETVPENDRPTLFDPQKPSHTEVIPHDVFRKKGADGKPTYMTLYDVYVEISNALKTATPIPYEFKNFAYDNGFAVLTKAERINPQAETITKNNGTQRIDLDEHPIESVNDYINLLFNVPENRFRYVAFIVTREPNPITTSTDTLERVALDNIFDSGTTILSKKILNPYLFTEDYKCEIHIYEFETIQSQDNIEGSSEPKTTLPKDFHLKRVSALQSFLSPSSPSAAPSQ